VDIKSGNQWPSRALSNFAGNRFEIDGVICNSMEGFLQSLKFKNPDMQIEICKLVGYAAKKAGSKKNWQREQKLYWRGQELGRSSKEYQDLLDKAYISMYEQSESFRSALLYTKGNLTHSIGRKNSSETILTKSEFCSRLIKLRDNEGKLEW